jgi:hypothetical protein
VKRSGISIIARRIASRSPQVSTSSQRGPSGKPARWLITCRIVTCRFSGTALANSGQYFTTGSS